MLYSNLNFLLLIDSEFGLLRSLVSLFSTLAIRFISEPIPPLNVNQFQQINKSNKIHHGEKQNKEKYSFVELIIYMDTHSYLF